MFIAYIVVAIVLALMLVMSGRAKLTHDKRVVESLTGIGVPLGWFPFLAGCEIAGALGLIVGGLLAPLGIAAAAGVVLYFAGAVTAHLRARDLKGLTAPSPLLVLAIAALVLRIVSA